MLVFPYLIPLAGGWSLHRHSLPSLRWLLSHHHGEGVCVWCGTWCEPIRLHVSLTEQPTSTQEGSVWWARLLTLVLAALQSSGLDCEAIYTCVHTS